MKLLASGRASDVYDLGDGRVLRRFKTSGDPRREAVVMEHVRSHGYPVPRVLEVHVDSLVLERVDGRTMADELRRRPRSLGGFARELAALQQRLHMIEAPPGIPGAGAGTSLLHLDFHPANVLLPATGPVVIDWTNARAGDPALDVALTWVVCATSGGSLGRQFTRAFLEHVDLEAARQALPRAVERRLADPRVLPAERAAIRGLLEYTDRRTAPEV